MLKTKKLTKKCCQKRGCKKKKCNPIARFERFFDYLSNGAYILCGCLIIYSLLMLNGLMASDAQLKNSNLLAKATEPVVLELEEFWTNTLYSGEAGNPLLNTIEWSSQILAKSFSLSGKVLAKAPEILTAQPPYAVARGYNRW